MRLSRLFDLIRPYRRELALLAGLNVLAAVAALALPWLGGSLLGDVLAGRGGIDQGTLIALLAALVAVTIASILATFVSTRLNATLRADLRRRLFDHVQRLPISFHDQHGKGDTLALLTYESWRLGEFVAGTLAATPARLLTVVGATAIMFRIDARLALIVPLLIPAFYLALKVVGRRLRSLAFAQQRAEASAIELAEESLEMLPVTKSFTREFAQNERYRAVTGEVADLEVRLGRLRAIIDPMLALAAALSATIVLLVAGEAVRSGTLGIAALLSFVLYAALLSRPVSALAHIYGEFQVARGTFGRLQRVLDEAPERLALHSDAVRSRGAIAFDNVHFAFPGRAKLLDGLSLSIAPGETIALVGANGAGKSALIGLLLRYYDVHSGQIRLDGENVASLNLSDLRRQIGLVPQMPYLLNGSIRDNIAFGREGSCSDAEIESAARLAQAHDFIARLPEGYDTIIGNRGIRLSGGQRQRVALARALIKDPPVLVLDEATAMVDIEGEASFVSDCRAALEGRTTILITHRPALFDLADRRVEIAAGKARVLELAERPE